MKQYDPLLDELVLETPWNLGALEHALERARLAEMTDDDIRRLLTVGGPQLIHDYVAAMKPHMLYACWCGQKHWHQPLGDETFRNFGHILLEPFGRLLRWWERVSTRGEQ